MQEAPQKPSNQWLITGVLALVATVLAPILAMLRTMSSMDKAKEALGQHDLEGGVGALGGHIGEVLVGTAMGLLVSLICLPIGIFCLVKHSRLRKQQLAPKGMTNAEFPNVE